VTRIRFVSADGTRTIEAEGTSGERLLDIAQAHGQPLEGACDGAMACSTCHVFIAPEQFALLPRPSEAEEDMLDFAPHASRYSRLACQIVLSRELPELTVRMPPASADARR